MSEFKPVATMDDLETIYLPDARMGYQAGLDGAPEPIASIFSRSYWHGWRMGRFDAGLVEPDEAHVRLQDEYNSIITLH